MRLAGNQHPPMLSRHLLLDEHVIVATRAHWACLVEPAVTAALGFVVVSWVTGLADTNATYQIAQFLWWVWLALVGRFLWKAAEWANEWFAVTDKRLLKTFGLFTRHVAMMPLRKVTDMNYTRSPAGRILGYGKFELESAGQEQAMREINWLPDPDEIYQRVGDAVFGVHSSDPDEDGPDPSRRYRRSHPVDPYDVQTAAVDAFDPPPDRHDDFVTDDEAPDDAAGDDGSHEHSGDDGGSQDDHSREAGGDDDSDPAWEVSQDEPVDQVSLHPTTPPRRTRP